MAGGVNPFGFTAGIIPAPRVPRQPQDLPSAPFGFAPPPSKMAQTLAILNEYNPLPAFERLMNSPMALGGPISEQDIADGLMVSGSVMGGSAAAPKPRNALNMGIRAYHGSPHDFDRFDMSKIGTGEGAQAYGHGLYFAEAEDIARSYRDALKHKGTIDLEGEAYRMGLPLSKEAQIEFRRQAAVDKNDPMRAAMWLQSASAQTRGMPQEKLAELIDRYRNSQKGHMYEVNINADPEQFLDWDKPLSEQSEAVKNAFRSMDIADESVWPNITANDAYEMLRVDSMGDDAFLRDQAYRLARRAEAGAGASRMLREAGIPGIKYLDAGSRAAGDGSRNYVVFDQNLISIVRKYGIAGASAMLGYNILDGMDPAQADELKRIEGNQ